MKSAIWTVLGVGAVLTAAWFLLPEAPGQRGETGSPAAATGAGRVVVDLLDGADENALADVERRLGADLDWVHPEARDEALAAGAVPDLEAALAAMRGLPGVEAAEPSVSMAALGFPNDPLYPQQWHLDAMGAPAGWARTPRGAGVVVAVLDTGVAPLTEIAGSRLLPGVSFIAGEPTAVDGNGHGTHVAGTIAQNTDNGVGTAGVAPEALILPVKVLSAQGFGSSEGIAAGIDWAVDHGAQVINLSLGGGYSEVVEIAARKARAQGVLVIAAAGNSGSEGVSWPGALPSVIGVGAVGPDGAPAPYSSWGEGVDLAAPGGDKRRPGGGVLQATIDGAGTQQFLEFQGTSMATPHVSGAAAALLSAGHSPDAVEAALLASGGEAWEPHLGRGAIDLAKAIWRVQVVEPGTRFGLAALVTWILAGLGGMGAFSRLLTAGIAGAAAGGLFFVPPLGPVSLTLRQAILHMPAPWLGPWAVGFPLWLTAIIPFVASFLFGAFRATRPLGVGIAAGVGVHLIYGAATATLHPWFLPGKLGGLWLTGFGLLSLLLAMAPLGAARMEKKS